MLWKIAVVADVLLLLFLAAAVGRWRASRHRATRGGRAEGTVTGHRRQLWSSGPHTWTPATLVFAIVSYRDRAGHEHTTQVVGDLPVGQTVWVLFDPDQPHRAFAEPRGGSVFYLKVIVALLVALAACAALTAAAG